MWKRSMHRSQEKTGFFTQAMSEKAFKEKSAQVGEIISRIRVEE